MTEAVKTEAVSKPSKDKTLRDLIDADDFKLAVARVLPKHITPDRFVRVAMTAMLKTPKLLECDRASFFNALLSLSQMGLEPDGRRAHLIPFRNTKKNIVECQLVVDYKGFAELVMRSGLVSNIHGDVVCEGDVFEYDRGELKKHTIDFRKPRVDAYCVYSLVRFKDGTEKCEVMTVDEVEAIRRRSKSADEGPWVTDWREMAKKTVFKRLSKWLPLTPEIKDAIDADEELIDARRFENALPIGSSFELPPAGPAFAPVTKTPKAAIGPEVSKAKTSDQDQVPDDSGLSAVPVPEKVESVDVPGKPGPATTAPRTIQMDLESEVAKVTGATFETFRAVAVALGWINVDKPIEHYSELSDSTARKLYGARIGLAKALTEAVAKGIV